jgi:hypothetical protein
VIESSWTHESRCIASSTSCREPERARGAYPCAATASRRSAVSEIVLTLGT